MKKSVVYLSILSVAAIFSVFVACKKNANGRNTLNLVDDATVLSLSGQQYTSFMSANPAVTGTPAADMVARVGQRLTAGTTQYLNDKGNGDLVKNYAWEFNLVNNSEVNAWCLPGGKIVVYTGIIPLTLSDTDLAVVMGHEIAHAVLKHGNERMSEQLLAQYGGLALSALLSTKPAETQELFNNAYGVSSSLSILAFSRNQEMEADEMGLYFMAQAGYNPNAAVGFWERMSANSSGTKPPVFLSTHPGDQQRIDNIKKILPDALKYYKQ